MLRHFFEAVGRPPDRVGPQKLFAWAYGRSLSGRERSAATIGGRLACLSSFYRFLIRMGPLAANPCDAVERPRPPHGRTVEPRLVVVQPERGGVLRLPALALPYCGGTLLFDRSAPAGWRSVLCARTPGGGSRGRRKGRAPGHPDADTGHSPDLAGSRLPRRWTKSIALIDEGMPRSVATRVATRPNRGYTWTEHYCTNEPISYLEMARTDRY